MHTHRHTHTHTYTHTHTPLRFTGLFGELVMRILAERPHLLLRDVV